MAFDSRRWRSPHTVTVFGGVADADVPALRAELARREPELRLAELSKVHFARLFVIGPDRDLQGRPLPARLVMSVVFDGDAESLLTEWVEIAGDALVAVLGHCVDGPTRRDQVVPFLLTRCVRPDTFHIGTVGSSAEQIRDERRLAHALRGFIDAHLADEGPPVRADEIRRRALEFVRSRRDLPQQPRPGRTLLSRIRQAAELGRTVLVVLAAPLGVAFAYTLGTRGSRRTFLASLAAGTALEAAVGASLVRYLELTEADVVIRQDDAKVRELVEREDFFIQNQFTMVAPVRDSAARRLIMRVTLFLSDEFSKNFSRAGRLVGVETIHFARIHQIDNGRRFLFMSDFDGGWDRYLFDFLTTGAFAVVPNWTNLRGCPKTKFLLIPLGGFAERFLPFTRSCQLPTDVWYSAHPDLMVGDVLKNAKIRGGLFSRRRSGADRWARLL